MTRDHQHPIISFYTVTAIVVAIAAATILSGYIQRICATPEQRAWVMECIRASTVAGEDVGENVHECRVAGNRLFEQTAAACEHQEKP